MRIHVAALALVLTACGSSYEKPAEQQPGPSSGKFEAIAPVVARSCGRCHSNGQSPKLESEAAFKTAKVLQLIESGRMPPGGRLPAADKAALVGFLRG